MQRRRLLQSLSAAAVAPLASPASAEVAPIRIGMMAPLTGVIANGGREMVDGVTLFLDQTSRRLAGRPVELMVEDDAGLADVAVQKARRLVEQRGAHFLLGNLVADTGLAVADWVRGNGIPYFTCANTDALTQRKRQPNVIRAGGFSASQLTFPLGDFAYRKRGWRKVVTLSQDYPFGWEQCGGFAQVFSELGGQVLQQFWNPINTADFDPFLAKIQALKPDAVFAMQIGADATRLLRQWKGFGLVGRIPLMAAVNSTDQSAIRTLGSECEGVLSSAHFCEGAEAAATRKFVADYGNAFAKLPSVYAFSNYTCMMFLDAALRTLDGKVEDRARLLDAVRAVKLPDSPLGRPVALDAYGNAVYDIYIRELRKHPGGSGYWNVPVDMYPSVSQFWRYDPETFLKQPPYSRSFQGIKRS